MSQRASLMPIELPLNQPYLHSFAESVREVQLLVFKALNCNSKRTTCLVKLHSSFLYTHKDFLSYKIKVFLVCGAASRLKAFIHFTLRNILKSNVFQTTNNGQLQYIKKHLQVIWWIGTCVWEQRREEDRGERGKWNRGKGLGGVSLLGLRIILLCQM